MTGDNSTRIAIAVLMTVGLVFVARQLGASWIEAAFVLGAGFGCLVLLLVGSAEEPRPIVPATQPVDPALQFIEAIAEPVLLVAGNTVRGANAAARSLLGAHIVGEDVRLAIRHPAAAERLAAAAPDGAVELVGLGGRDQRVEMQVATLDTGRRIVHLIDRSTRYAAERARVDFVANASHELRTPLSAILGFIETLDDDNAGGDAEVRARFLGVMFQEARRMQRLIEDLISLSRIEAEKYQLPATSISLPDLMEEVTGELRDSEGVRRGDLKTVIAPDLPAITGDRAQLSQVVHNLVGNALKYGRKGSKVAISLEREGANLVKLSISDQGDGIAAEHLPRLTERFYRVDPGRSRALGGTGLGLAIVKHIVERHRGRLDIASIVGVGTTVSIMLPVAVQPVVTETSPS